MELNRSRFRLVWYFLFYGLVILYTVTFSTTVAWFLFYAFTLLLLLSFLSTRHTFVIQHINWYKTDENRINLSLTLTSKRKLPFFLSSIRLSLLKDNESSTQYKSSFFSRKVPVTFDSLLLPRGLHEQLTLEFEAVSLFGIWRRRLSYQIPVNVAVYPSVLTKSNRAKLMKTITPNLMNAMHSSLHEFYVKEIRNYQNRDAFSAIDWKTSLRRGQWMVKDYDLEEEAPIDLYFYGGSSTDFEFLLSVTYSLYIELNELITAQLYLVGEFEEGPALRQAEHNLLTIQPSTNDRAMAQIIRQSLSTDRKHILIKASDCKLPTGLTPAKTDSVFDEHDLHFLKGG
ncbi:MAG: DUF58 domain-containing protein [Alkalibacterium sp.]|nr:DUF58 domain-containing protein [Alkalibacterium sp.]